MIKNNLKALIINMFLSFVMVAGIYRLFHNLFHKYDKSNANLLEVIVSISIPVIVFWLVGYYLMKDQGSKMKNLLSVSLFSLISLVVFLLSLHSIPLQLVFIGFFAPLRISVVEIIGAFNPHFYAFSTTFLNQVNMWIGFLSTFVGSALFTWLGLERKISRRTQNVMK